MLEDVRNHSAMPTAEETAWIATNAVSLFMRAVALAGVALVIGVSASVLVEGSQFMPDMFAAAGK